jgi:hypothetical protein
MNMEIIGIIVKEGKRKRGIRRGSQFFKDFVTKLYFHISCVFHRKISNSYMPISTSEVFFLM